MASTETVASLIRRARRRLDEPLDPGTNLWADSELIEAMNEGLREVWQTIREAHEDRFVRTLHSTDGVINLATRDYDTALLGVAEGRDEIVLPPDFHELLLFEDEDARLTFDHARLAHPNFRENAVRTSNSSGTCFYYNIEWRDGMAVMVFAPSPQVVASTVIKYVQAVRDMRKDETFENTGFEPFMLDAVLAFIKYRALSKTDDVQAVTLAQSEWESKRTFALRACGPRQSRDPEVVQGIYEEEW